MALLRRQPWYLRNDLVLPDVSTPTRECQSRLFCYKGAVLGDLAGTPGPEGAPPNSAKATLKQSCDSVSVSTADLLGGAVFDATKWVRATAGNPHTWYWVQYATGFRICISWDQGVDYQFSAWGAFTDFTGGTTTARPTSTTEFPMFGTSSISQQFADNSASAGKVHFSFAADGSFYALGSKDGNNGPAWGMFAGKLDNPITTGTPDPTPYVGLSIGSSWPGGVNNIGTGSMHFGGRNPINTAAQDGAIGTPNFQFGTMTAITGLGPDGKTPQEPAPAYYWPGQGSGVGRKGYLPDAFWASMLPSDRMGPPTPPAAQYEYTRTGALWLPWSLLPTY